MARTKSTYEWAWEATDESGEITDCDYFPTLAECQGQALTGADVALVKRYGNDDDGEVGRTYAYLQAGPEGELKLPETFDDGTTVPQRFHKEAR